jgi:glycosyltransferase involved in cell wall biosynthesis
MKTAIVYDRVNKIGGAERVLESIGELFPKAVLFTSVYDKKKTPWAKKFRVKTSFLQNFFLLRSKHEYIPYLMPKAFESFNLKNYDLVISVTSEFAKAVKVPKEIPHICICLTPTRYLWSGYDEYFKNFILRSLTLPLVSYLRKKDILASKNPTAFIAISENVKKRIKKYYKRESIVIYPPSDRLFKEKYKSVEILEKDYFLVVSRLVDYKKIDLAVKACTSLDLNLVVIGEGKEWEVLTALAGPTIHFKGKVTDDELISYYKSCKALIFPGDEDFGITMVEAQMAGKPVIAYRGGGALEIVKNGKTGVFFNEQNVESLCNVLKKFKTTRYNSQDSIENAKRFSEKNFKKDFVGFLKKHKYI